MAKILLDECVPVQLRQLLPEHAVETTDDQGWKSVKNGALLLLAKASFDIYITSDKNHRFQAVQFQLDPGQASKNFGD